MTATCSKDEMAAFEGFFEQAFRQWLASRSGSGQLPAVEAVLTVGEFCKANKISLSHFHKLKRAGDGPREIHAGGRVLISQQANRDWRLAREKSQSPSPPEPVEQEAA